jgi:mono/diheme cytochrome c family protein
MKLVGLMVLASASLIAAAASQTPPLLPAPVAGIFQARCVKCHGGPTPASRLSLEADKAPALLIGRTSAHKADAVLVAPGDPAGSYLLAKIQGLAGIKGRRMPIGADPLAADDTARISDWVKSMKPAGR